VTRAARLVVAVGLACASTATCSRDRETAATSTGSTTAARTSSEAGSSIDALVPAGWRIEQRHDADLNGDGKADAILVLRQGDAAVPPRTLLVALATNAPATFAASAQNAKLIPSDPSGQIEDPLIDGGIEVRPQEFDVTLALVSASGSAQTATIRYRFHWQNGCFQLVEFRRAETNRASLDIRDMTANLVTGEVISTSGNESTGDRKTETSPLTNLSPRCLPDLPGGLDYDPTRS
jgi:hypothetical protein